MPGRTCHKNSQLRGKPRSGDKNAARPTHRSYDRSTKLRWIVPDRSCSWNHCPRSQPIDHPMTPHLRGHALHAAVHLINVRGNILACQGLREKINEPGKEELDKVSELQTEGRMYLAWPLGGTPAVASPAPSSAGSHVSVNSGQRERRAHPSE